MKMDQGYCASAILVRVAEGTSDGVDLAGRNVVLATDFPGPTLFDGNGTARLYIDNQASAAQQKALDSILQGKQGGPMAVLAPLVSKWLVTKTAPIQVSEKNGTITAKAGRYGTVRSNGLTDEGGKATTLRNAVFTSALKMGATQLAPSASKWSDPDMPREIETNSGARGNIRWSGR
ncbi:MAG: DUF1326 domain-containing protein [Chloroflexi bacterium]|nr:DUF1326 domain-containing protein [Chloroflexota bacterium]